MALYWGLQETEWRRRKQDVFVRCMDQTPKNHRILHFQQCNSIVSFHQTLLAMQYRSKFTPPVFKEGISLTWKNSKSRKKCFARTRLFTRCLVLCLADQFKFSAGRQKWRSCPLCTDCNHLYLVYRCATGTLKLHTTILHVAQSEWVHLNLITSKCNILCKYFCHQRENPGASEETEANLFF